MSKFGLDEKNIDAINYVFSKHVQIKKAILYGSRAKGNYKDGSDIDLALDATDLSFNELLMIENQLDDLMLPYTIDLSTLSQIENEDLLDHIKRVGKIFYSQTDRASAVNEPPSEY